MSIVILKILHLFYACGQLEMIQCYQRDMKTAIFFKTVYPFLSEI